MSFISDLFTKGSSGVTGSAQSRGQSSSAVRNIENLCAQLGWSIDDRVSDNGICLDFRDQVWGTRQVQVIADEVFTVFWVFSRAEWIFEDIPDALGVYLLLRSMDGLFNSWKMTKKDAEKFRFVNSYCALTDGLDAHKFKLICETLVKEAKEVDSGLRSKGLI